MKGLDTNVLVRYLVQDDRIQSQKAEQFIERECTRESPGFINRIVLCELVWVLESAYGYSQATIAGVLEKILRTRQFQIENLEAAWIALREYQKREAEFTDYLISAVNRQSGCDHTVTFDKKAGQKKGFVLLR